MTFFFKFWFSFWGVLGKRMLNPEVLKCHEDIITLDTYVQQGKTMVSPVRTSYGGYNNARNKFKKCLDILWDSYFYYYNQYIWIKYIIKFIGLLQQNIINTALF